MASQQQSTTSYQTLPHEPGIYLFLGRSHELLYVGKAKDLKNRVSSYFSHTQLHPKTALLVSQIKKINYIIVESELESLLLEANFIKKYSPKYNVKLTDNKAYPLIRITVKDQYPAVLTGRRPDDKNSVYFGPYPNVKAMRTVLRLVRRIFPYQSIQNHPKKICLYHHLGLCPCVPAMEYGKEIGELRSEAPEWVLQPIPKRFRKQVGVILTPGVESTSHENRYERGYETSSGKDRRGTMHRAPTQTLRDYKKTIYHLIDFLDGKTKKVVKDLEKERDTKSKEEDFEGAQKIQKQIDAINYVTHPAHKPFEYETNPNLREDIRSEETKDLAIILQHNNVPVLNLHRIECYDISNFQGKQAVASMVVLIDGEIDKSQYRRFKMHSKGPNDFAMMQEVLTRRLKHTEWETPSLIIVDGGKGQISSAKKVLDEIGSSIPLVGLAKREEIIITPEFVEIVLPHRTKALQLVMRIRDEAHRFAITYHRKLRSKMFLR